MNHSAALQAVGWLATAVTLSSGLPQMVRLLRTRDTQGVSEWTYVLWTATALWWASWGLHIDSAPMIAVNVLSLPTLLAVVVLMRPGRWQIVLLALSPPLIAVAYVTWPPLLAVVGSILAPLLVVPSVYEAFHTDDPSGVALATWFLLGTASFLWLTFNVGIGYPWAGLSVAVQGVLAATVIARTTWDRRSQVPTSSSPGESASSAWPSPPELDR